MLRSCWDVPCYNKVCEDTTTFTRLHGLPGHIFLSIYFAWLFCREISARYVWTSYFLVHWCLSVKINCKTEYILKKGLRVSGQTAYPELPVRHFSTPIKTSNSSTLHGNFLGALSHMIPLRPQNSWLSSITVYFGYRLIGVLRPKHIP